MDGTIERQFTEQHDIGNVPPLDDTLGRQNAERDRQVERRAGFADVGGRQVDGDPVGGKLEAGVANRAADAISALADADIGQAYQREPRHPERDIDLDVDGAGIHPEHGCRPQAREHDRTAAIGRPDIQSFLQRLSGSFAESATPHARRRRNGCAPSGRSAWG